jgi:hypothetical protein
LYVIVCNIATLQKVCLIGDISVSKEGLLLPLNVSNLEVNALTLIIESVRLVVNSPHHGTFD